VADSNVWIKAAFQAASNAQARTAWGRWGKGRYAALKTIDALLDQYHSASDANAADDCVRHLMRISDVVTSILADRARTGRTGALTTLRTQVETRLETLIPAWAGARYLQPDPQRRELARAVFARATAMARSPRAAAVRDAMTAAAARLRAVDPLVALRTAPPPTPRVAERRGGARAASAQVGVMEARRKLARRAFPDVRPIHDTSLGNIAALLPRFRRDAGRIDPADLRATCEFGYATPPFLLWLIKNRMILAGAIDASRTEVDFLSSGGSSTISIFRARETGGAGRSFIIKEIGEKAIRHDVPYPLPRGVRMYQALDSLTNDWALRGYGERDGVHELYKDERVFVQLVSRSEVGLMGRLSCAEGVKVQISVEQEFVSYDAESNGRTFRHLLSILNTARGGSFSEILDKPNAVAEQTAAARAIGVAIGAVHRKYAQAPGAREYGLVTYVHGDFFPPNVFFDEKAGLVSLIDVAGMGLSIAGGGSSMFVDVKRMAGQLHGGVLEAFFVGYAQNFSGRRDYTIAEIRTLCQNPLIPAQLLLSDDPAWVSGPAVDAPEDG